MSSADKDDQVAAPVADPEATPTPDGAEGAEGDAVQLDENGKPISKSALKKQAKMAEAAARKAKAEAERAAKLAEQESKRAAVLEESKSRKLDNKLGPAPDCSVADSLSQVGKRVRMHGWASLLRRQGDVKGGIIFVDLRDGTGVPNTVQVVMSGELTRTYDALTMSREATMYVWGTLQTYDRAYVEKAEDGSETKRTVTCVELIADYWELVHGSAADIESVVTRDSNPDTLLDQRHLVLRQTRHIYIMRLRSIILQCFREHFFGKGYFEVTPPTIVQTQVEGGSTLFKFDYFGSQAYLTQSSQLYLETAVPALGKVFCVMPSFRAEKHRTRRHLSEYTHFEGELGFITFDDLLQTLEDMVVGVSELVVAKAGDLLKVVNPKFAPPKRGFRRMAYTDAIEWLNAHNVFKDEAKQERYEFGDDIPEAPERLMVDTIGEPIMLTRFPTSMKPFYMQRVAGDERFTESCDLLVPGVGEIVGSSMRTWDLDKLLAGFKHEGIDPSTYYWYNDLRKYGSCPHGGWGLGVERFVCWMLGIEHIRDACLYPRFTGRAQP